MTAVVPPAPPPLPPDPRHEGRSCCDRPFDYLPEPLGIEDELTHILGTHLGLGRDLCLGQQSLLDLGSVSCGGVERGQEAACGSTNVAVLTWTRSSVRPVLQNGPMCGLVALSMASQQLPRPQPQPQGPTLRAWEDGCDPESLLERARDLGMSRHGELFSAEWMLQLATESIKFHHCSGKVCRAEELLGSPLALIDSLLSGRALLVPYDADKDHTPCLRGGRKSHWCLLVGFAITLSQEGMGEGGGEGGGGGTEPSSTLTSEMLSTCCDRGVFENHFFVTDTKRFLHLLKSEPPLAESLSLSKQQLHVFARHGKSRRLGFWRCDKLLESTGNLREPCDPKENRSYVIPKEGIPQTLSSKVVVLF